jgi:hypothetical protein
MEQAMRANFFSIILILSLLAVANVSWAQPSEMDVLLDVMVHKGLLNEKEAKAVRFETEKIVTQQRKETIEIAKKEIKRQPSFDTPEWVKKFKIGGDLRLRYQRNDLDGKEGGENNRTRVRFRLKLSSKINDKLEIKARISTGPSDPRSTNQTFGESFSSKDIVLDRVYAKYTANSYMTLYAGKFGKTFHSPSDLLWDSDLSYEGMAIQMKKKFSDIFIGGINAGVYVIDDINTEDPVMFMIQPTMEWKVNKSFTWIGSVGYVGFENLQDSTRSTFASDQNTLVGGSYKYDYDAFIATTEFSFKVGTIPRFAIIAEYVLAKEPNDNNEGGLIGFELGHKKVKIKGQWKLFYNYRELQSDAFYGGFPDADFYGGNTNVRGKVLGLSYAFADNVVGAVKLYRTENIDGAEELNEDLLQTDIIISF